MFVRWLDGAEHRCQVRGARQCRENLSEGKGTSLDSEIKPGSARIHVPEMNIAEESHGGTREPQVEFGRGRGRRPIRTKAATVEIIEGTQAVALRRAEVLYQGERLGGHGAIAD